MTKKEQGEELVKESITSLSDQITDLFSQAKNFSLPKNYQDISQVVVNGMGGSNLGARIILSLFADKLRVPLIVVPAYQVPEFVSEKTLYIASSYSGNTEETLFALKTALKKKAKILAISAKASDEQSNALINASKKFKFPVLDFEPKFNPSRQPRLALGYSVAAQIIALIEAGVLKAKKEEILKIVSTMKGSDIKLAQEAKKIAKQIASKTPILLAGNEFEGNLHSLRNQINETSKNFSCYLTFPDLNHHAMEGLLYPKTLNSNIIFLVFNSRFYHPRVVRRIKLTEEVMRKNKLKFIEHDLSGKNIISDGFELLQFGSWLSFYLALSNNVNPQDVIFVDWFKKELAK